MKHHSILITGTYHFLHYYILNVHLHLFTSYGWTAAYWEMKTPFGRSQIIIQKYLTRLFHTSLRDDASDKVTERLVASLVGMKQPSFLPCYVYRLLSLHQI